MARHERRGRGRQQPSGTGAAAPGAVQTAEQEVVPASGDDRWEPVIVGDPTLDFEPCPAATVPYRPDTIFDGWSAGPATVRLASVRGYSHRYHGMPRQDDAEVAFHQPSGAVLFAVADGVSSASQSHLGASVACRSAVGTLRRQLDSGDQPDWNTLAHEAADALMRRAAWLTDRAGRPDTGVAEKLVATTLTAGYVVRDGEHVRATVIQIGDSGTWVLYQDQYHAIGLPKIDPSQQVISSAVTALPRIPAALQPAQITLPPGAVLLVGTDGFGDPLGDGDGRVGQLFAHHLATPPPARALAHLLDFSRETFDDDRTLIAVWPRATGRGEAR